MEEKTSKPMEVIQSTQIPLSDMKRDPIYCDMKLDPIYYDLTLKRWEEYTGEQAEHLGNFIKGNTE